VHLPPGWRLVPNPGEVVNPNYIRRDFANEPVRSSLSLDGNGVWMTVSLGYMCGSRPAVDGTAQAVVSTPEGPASLFYFEDPHSPVGEQPFSGYAFSGSRPLGDLCMTFRFTSSSDSSREQNLPTFIAIVQQANFVK
jgi:hypothetical protein